MQKRQQECVRRHRGRRRHVDENVVIDVVCKDHNASHEAELRLQRRPLKVMSIKAADYYSLTPNLLQAGVRL
jgi:hypothetical protein